MPSCMQVISILLMLGNDNDDIIVGKMLKNHVVQIPTGEGKSIVLGVLSIILSLLGYRTYCVCYRSYLSTRDYKEFADLFHDFGVTEFIEYGTFEELSEKIINQNGDVRDATLALIKKKGLVIQRAKEERKKVLLVDEVDWMLTPSLLGNLYRPNARLTNVNVQSLLTHIWKEVLNDISFADVIKLQCYQELVEQYKEWKLLIDS